MTFADMQTRWVVIASKLARSVPLSAIATELKTTEWEIEAMVAEIAKVLSVPADCDPRPAIGAWYRAHVRLYDEQDNSIIELRRR